MRLLLLIAFLLSLLRADASDVVAATVDDFDSVIKKGEIALVKFYAPWCGHCQKLAPEWEKAAKEVPGEAIMVDVDCTKETKLAEKYSIKGFPTIILFRNGEEVETYKGARQSDAIVKYIKANVGPAAVYPTTAEEVEKLKEEHEILCVGLTSDAESPLAKELLSVAQRLRMKMKFAIVTKPEIVPGEKAETVVVYRKDDEKEVYQGNMEADNLKNFLETAVVPFAGEIGPANYLRYAELSKPVGWVLLKPKEELSKELQPKLLEVGKKMRQHLAILWVDAEQYPVWKNLGVSEDAKYPAFVIAKGDKHHVLPTSEPATVESIEEFIVKYAEGKTDAELKSQPVPEVETVDGLTTIVGKTMNKYLSSGKDILIEFFAPWCGHCKNFAGTYAKVAKEFESSDVIIAAIDATANDVDRSLFDVTGFPTLYFVPSGGKPILYNGDRTFYDLYKFIRDHSSSFKDDKGASVPKEEKKEEVRSDEDRGDL
ncbi:protein disulfide isomerase [Trypanosoma theileri]|uniref:Protein disulfide-isomerase n=1 Tax=Trypanosoma theileri TaxID=67003 RepID=A0A1X0NMX9_9TRYP|nr:protein disulfide isomerase [Trypanosoma theileri]ORC85500.1 protein disulfide isomerase [Trypanosoma theileri]